MNSKMNEKASIATVTRLLRPILIVALLWAVLMHRELAGVIMGLGACLFVVLNINDAVLKENAFGSIPDRLQAKFSLAVILLFLVLDQRVDHVLKVAAFPLMGIEIVTLVTWLTGVLFHKVQILFDQYNTHIEIFAFAMALLCVVSVMTGEDIVSGLSVISALVFLFLAWFKAKNSFPLSITTPATASQ